MNNTTVLILAAVGLGAVYMMTRKTATPVMSTSAIPPNANGYSVQQQYPQYPGALQNMGGSLSGLFGGAVGGGSNPTQAQQAASVISAIGGLANGIGSVVRGIGEWSSNGSGGTDDGWMDTSN